MMELLGYEFMRNAIFAGVLISIACGVVGSLVVVNRMVFLSGGIAHAAYGGIGLAFFLSLPPLLCAAVFAIVAAVVMGYLALGHRHRIDTVIGAVWAAGMAVGILFIDMSPGYAADLMGYLFGSILTVSGSEVVMMLVLDISAIAITAVFYRQFVAMSYDEDFAALRGVPVRALYFLLLIMSALTVVMTIQAVGLILVIALLTIPQFIAERFARSLLTMMVTASVLGVLFTLSGLVLSYRLNLSSGATIIIVASFALFLFLAAGRFFRRA